MHSIGSSDTSLISDAVGVRSGAKVIIRVVQSVRQQLCWPNVAEVGLYQMALLHI